MWVQFGCVGLFVGIISCAALQTVLFLIVLYGILLVGSVVVVVVACGCLLRWGLMFLDCHDAAGLLLQPC